MLISMIVLYSGFPTTNVCPGRRHFMIILDSFSSTPVSSLMALDLSLKVLNSLSQTTWQEKNNDVKVREREGGGQGTINDKQIIPKNLCAKAMQYT